MVGKLINVNWKNLSELSNRCEIIDCWNDDKYSLIKWQIYENNFSIDKFNA